MPAQAPRPSASPQIPSPSRYNAFSVKRAIVRLLVLLLLANTLGIAHAEATAGLHSSATASKQPQDIDNKNCPIGPRCRHACHLALHFIGMIGTPLPVATTLGEGKLSTSYTWISLVPAGAPFRPPRALT